MLATLSVPASSTLDSVIRFILRSPRMSSVIGGIGLGNLFFHLPRFRKEKVQTIGIGVLTAGYLLDSAAHLLLAGSSIGALGVATVALLAGGTAIATYAGLEWAGNHKSRKSVYATVAVAGFGALHFGSHVYMAIRALFGVAYASASLFGAGILGLLGNLALVIVATGTLVSEVLAHRQPPGKSQATRSPAGEVRSQSLGRIRRGTAKFFGLGAKPAKVLRNRARVA